MKKLYTLLAFLITIAISAQAPQGFNYQATVRNNAGALMINKNVTFKFNVMKDTPTSVPVFSETHYVPTDDLGAVNLVIGKGTATTGTFAGIDWETGTYFLGIELNTGNGFIAMGTSQLLSVPYALYAKSSGNAIAPGTVNGQLLYWNGTAWVTLAPGANGTNLKLNNGLPVWENSVGSIPSGTATGQLLYWNGTAWVTLAPGTDGKILRWANGSPTWDSTVPNIVLNDYVFYFNKDENNRLRLILRPKLIDDGGERIIEKGIYYSQTNSSPTENDLNSIIYDGYNELNDPFDANQNSLEQYEVKLRTENLIPGAQYYLRAYAINSKGKGYSDVIRVTTPTQPDTPVIEIPIITNITQVGATASWKIQQQIRETNTNNRKGIVWDTNPNPTIALSTQSIDNEYTGSTYVGEDYPSTTYYLRAFYTNGINTFYSPQVTFTTLPASTPFVNRTSFSNLTQSSVSISKYYNSDGGSPISEQGCVWSTNPNPTTTLNTKIISDQNQTQINITGLIPATTYYVRSFATNALGTSYSNELIIKTLDLSTPVFNNTSISSINANSINHASSIKNDGGYIITQKGFVWSTSPSPTIALSTKSFSDGINFSGTTTGLTPSTIYFIRAFATNALGTSYSKELKFTTLALTAPVFKNLSQFNISSITTSSGTFNDIIIISNGGSPITAQGIVWSTNPNPTTNLNTKLISNQNSITITGLTPATTYYVRYFATNALGTSYSNEVVIITLPLSAPVISNFNSSPVSQTTAVSSFKIFDGGSTISETGFVWSTSPNPTTALTTKSIVTDSITYISKIITGLLPATTYYVRGFATNALGTTYTLDVYFTTSP